MEQTGSNTDIHSSRKHVDTQADKPEDIGLLADTLADTQSDNILENTQSDLLADTQSY